VTAGCLNRGELLRRARMDWLPYLMCSSPMSMAPVYLQQSIYQPTLLGSIRGAPLSAIADHVRSISIQLYRTSAAAWSQVLQFPISGKEGPRTLAYYAVVVLLSAVVVGVWISLSRRQRASADGGRWWPMGLGWRPCCWRVGRSAHGSGLAAYPANWFPASG
jgi:hypothetical protein